MICARSRVVIDQRVAPLPRVLNNGGISAIG
jgi:hypothetical protein